MTAVHARGRSTASWRWVCCVMGCLIASGCGILEAGSDGGDDDLRHARARWARAAMADYDLVMTRNCFCVPVGPVLVRVRDGERVETLIAVDDAEGPLPANLVPFYPTVDGLFDVISEALEDGVYALQVTYHPTLGYPTDLWVDRSPSLSDEEFGYEVGLVSTEG